MNKEYISDELKTLIVNLKVIGSLQQGDKIRARSKKYIEKDPNVWYTPFLRMKNGEDRLFTSTIIENQSRSLREIVYSDSFDQFLDTTEGSMLLNELQETLAKAINGLSTLQNTYMNDDTFVSLISVEITILNQINERLIKKQPKKESLKEVQKESSKEVQKEFSKEVQKESLKEPPTRTDLLINEVEDYLKNN